MIVNTSELEQEFASVTVHVYVPAVKLVTEVVPSPVGLPGVQLYENGEVPPVAAFTDAEPFAEPLQETLV